MAFEAVRGFLEQHPHAVKIDLRPILQQGGIVQEEGELDMITEDDGDTRVTTPAQIMDVCVKNLARQSISLKAKTWKAIMNFYRAESNLGFDRTQRKGEIGLEILLLHSKISANEVSAALFLHMAEDEEIRKEQRDLAMDRLFRGVLARDGQR